MPIELYMDIMILKKMFSIFKIILLGIIVKNVIKY